MANAIVGTLILVGAASVIGLPVGIGAGLYLAEHSRNPLGVRHPVPRRRAQWTAVDRDGHLRVAVPRSADRSLLGLGRRASPSPR